MLVQLLNGGIASIKSVLFRKDYFLGRI